MGDFPTPNVVIAPGFVVEGDIWSLLNTSIQTEPMDLPGGENILWKISFLFKRKQQYYNITIFLTLELLSILLIAGIILEPDDSNRSAYSITVMLGFSISQSIVTQNIPKTSQPVFLFIYIGGTIVQGTLITIYNLVICFLCNDPWMQNKYRGIRYVRLIDLVMFIFSIVCFLSVNAYYFAQVIPDVVLQYN